MNSATEITLAEFVQKHQIKFEAHRVSERPDGLASESPRHFRCRISRRINLNSDGRMAVPEQTRSFGLYFSQGSAHTEPPTLEEVLDCLASDASGYENALPAANTVAHGNQGVAFNNWASEYGYDTDSRAAEKIYKVIKRQANQLKRVLGNEAYQELLWNTERL